jgi:hypothetical protein
MLFFSSFAFAQNYQWGYVNVSSNYVSATMVNYSFNPMYCEGRVWGIGPQGHWIERWVSSYVPPYQSRTVYVYAYGNQWFVRGNASIRCRFGY